VTRVLVTNDDGVHSPGLHVLARRLADEGYAVCVVAPDRDCSGAGPAIGHLPADQQIVAPRVELRGLAGIETRMVPGPPGLAVLAARAGAFGPPPDVVVSGINSGSNTGRLVLHSGTVGAALTAQNFGGCGLAVSLERSDEWQWDTAAAIAVDVLRWMLASTPARTVVNLNVPGLPLDQVRGLRAAALAPVGQVQVATPDGSLGGLQVVFEAARSDAPPDSDTALLAAGYATHTMLRGVSEISVDVQEGLPTEIHIDQHLQRVPKSGDSSARLGPAGNGADVDALGQPDDGVTVSGGQAVPRDVEAAGGHGEAEPVERRPSPG
jgi:5'-nucleotidase